MRDYFDRPDLFGGGVPRHRRRRGDHLVTTALVVACCVLGALAARAIQASQDSPGNSMGKRGPAPKVTYALSRCQQAQASGPHGSPGKEGEPGTG
jgi:hypothetical protein